MLLQPWVQHSQKEHIKLLSKLNVKVVLCMDNDSAGEMATIKNGEKLSGDGIETFSFKNQWSKGPR